MAHFYGAAQVQLTQDQAVTKTARMACRISGQGFNLNSAYIHWYRQRPGEAPKRILYIGSGTISKDEGFNSEKFTASNDVSASTANLRVDQLTLEDAATYYCATWDLFGSGTKLIVTGKLCCNYNNVLPPSPEQDGKVSYMCLIQDFYPDVIKVTWKDEDKKNAENNAVHEEIWSPGNNKQSYSISSWLTIDKNSNKNYRCHYQHESKEDFVPTASPGIYYIIKTSSIYI
uniref:Ig-like domain-containing protein n=1 Tax=Chrysemys picta bellii TaxID=8478 RepID=A0A8C3ILW9_CHRPI